MPRAKKAAKFTEDDRPSAPDEPCAACKRFVKQCVVSFYEAETTASLDSKYARYKEESADKFKVDMKQFLLDRLHTPQWKEDMDKRNFTEWLDKRVHDALWNAPVFLEKFGREKRPGDEAFQELLAKVDLFVKKCTPYANKRNRQGSISWWNSNAGLAQVRSNNQYFIPLADTVRVISQDDKVMRGGYGTIMRVRIEGCSQILPHWEFAAKQSLNYRKNPEIAKMEHFNEAMAMRIAHPGVI